MPKIQLIIEAESARHLASVINQMAHRYKPDSTLLDADLNAPLASKANGADEPSGVTAPYVAASGAPQEFPQEAEAADQPASAPKARGRPRKAAEPPAQPEEAPEVAPDELPSLDELKRAITKAVVAEPHGGPIRQALETLRPTLKINLIRNASEEHRAALWTFVQQQQIPVGAEA